MFKYKIAGLLSLIISSAVCAQVSFGKESLSSNSVSLEFGSGNKGLILPYISGVISMAGTVPGTIIMDAGTGVIQYAVAGNNWKALSFSGNHTFKSVTLNITGQVNTIVQSSLPDLTDTGVIIGNTNEAVSGVLILSDTNKAMVLPKMDSPHLNIKSPAPGMMAYDTLKKQLAVFNGTVWTFWKP